MARAAPHGHMLVDSSQTPGLITDVLVFRRDVIEKRAREIQGVVDAWNKAVAYWEKNPAESNEIMARAVGDWLKDPKLFADVLTGVRFYNRPANVKFFGTPRKPGPLYKVVQNALDIAGGSGSSRSRSRPRISSTIREVAGALAFTASGNASGLGRAAERGSPTHGRGMNGRVGRRSVMRRLWVIAVCVLGSWWWRRRRGVGGA